MTPIRELIRKGDPMLRISLPEELINTLRISAKNNKRRAQDEFIKNLAASLRNTTSKEALPIEFINLNSSPSKPYSQIIPKEMLEHLKQEATQNNFTLEKEIAYRLFINFSKPLSPVDTLLKHQSSHHDAINQCKHNRQKWLHLYEMEKLRLFMQLKDRLPKDINETFNIIDVKAAMAYILEEMKQENNDE